MGTHWLRVEQEKENKIVFKQIEVEGDTLVATDKDNNIFYKLNYSKDVLGKYAYLKYVRNLRLQTMIWFILIGYLSLIWF